MRKAIETKIKNLDTKTLEESIWLANDNLQIDNDTFELMLSELETRLSEDEFITFCEMM
jgi:hypothetical protein